MFTDLVTSWVFEASSDRRVVLSYKAWPTGVITGRLGSNTGAPAVKFMGRNVQFLFGPILQKQAGLIAL